MPVPVPRSTENRELRYPFFTEEVDFVSSPEAASFIVRGTISDAQLNHAGYQGPLTVEWEDPMMDREHGAREAATFTRRLDFARSAIAFDAAFERG